MQKKYESAITAAEIKQLRQIARNTDFDRMRNEGMRETLQQIPLIHKANDIKLNLYYSENRLVWKAMEAKREYERRNGRLIRTLL